MSPRRELGPWQTALLALFGITLPGVIFLVPIPRHAGLLLVLVPALGLFACGFTIYPETPFGTISDEHDAGIATST